MRPTCRTQNSCNRTSQIPSVIPFLRWLRSLPNNSTFANWLIGYFFKHAGVWDFLRYSVVVAQFKWLTIAIKIEIEEAIQSDFAAAFRYRFRHSTLLAFLRTANAEVCSSTRSWCRSTVCGPGRQTFSCVRVQFPPPHKAAPHWLQLTLDWAPQWQRRCCVIAFL